MNPVPLLRRPLAAVVVAALVVVGSGACSKDKEDDGEKKAAPVTTTTSTALTAPPTIALQITGLEANGTQAPDEATVAAVKATLDAWLAGAVVGPLFTGQPAGDLSAAFTPAALQRVLNDPVARSTMVAEGLPPATTSITATQAAATLSSVAGPDGVPAVIAAGLDILLRATGPTVDVDLNYYGEVVLVPEAGSWKIDAFEVTTKQDSRA